MGYQSEWRHWRYFLAVAEELHFKKAADKLYISQPGLSRQIKGLEEGLGIKLFERSNRKVELTSAGVFLKEEVSKLFQGFDHVLEHARGLSEGLLGTIKLGYVGSAMQHLIPDVLLEFEKDYPDVVFNLKEMEVSQQVDALHAHDLDVGFVRLDQAPRGLQMHRVLTEPFCLALPKDHRLNQKSFEHLSQLREEHFILFDPNYSPSYYQKVLQLFDDAGFTPIVTHNTIHASSIYTLVSHGLGISIVPQSLTSNDPNVKFISLDALPQRTSLSVVWNKENKNPVLTFLLGLLDVEDYS